VKNSTQPRNIKDGSPFCWQKKKALRLIRKSFEGDTTSALAVYVALTEIASDAKAETFPASAGYIANKAGVSRRTAIRFIKPFEHCGLIAVTRATQGTSHLPNTYTLLRVVK